MKKYDFFNRPLSKDVIRVFLLWLIAVVPAFLPYGIFIYLFMGIVVIFLKILVMVSNVLQFSKRYIKRKKLLKQNLSYLEPYSSIWNYQVLRNRFLKITLYKYAIFITADKRIFSIKSKSKNNINAVWDFILENFSSKVTYDNLLESIKFNQVQQNEKLEFKEKIITAKHSKIDINNCSEIELTSLAGVNIAIAKRIIKRRESIKGFKTIEDFMNFINLNSRFQDKIKDRITIKKVKILKPIKLLKERRIDL